MTGPCICTTVRKASRALTRHYENAMAGSGLSVVQFSILRSLARRGEMSLSRLADELAMERTSLYRTIAPLFDRGLILLEPAPRGRIKIARLTGEGRRLLEQAAPYWEDAQRSIRSRIGADAWRALASALEEIPAQVKSA